MGSILNAPVQYNREDFFSLLSLSAGTSIARQNAMGELVIGDNGWQVDIKQRKIFFGDNAFDCGILGREHNGAWIWGWADTEIGFPEGVFAPARRIKRVLGNAPEFSTAKFMLDEMRTGHAIAMISTASAEENVCYYRCPFEDGAFLVQVNGLPEEVFAPLEYRRIMRTLMNVISGLNCDHKLAAAGLLYEGGVAFEDNGGYIDAHFAQGDIRMVFEEYDGVYRVLDIGGSA